MKEKSDMRLEIPSIEWLYLFSKLLKMDKMLAITLKVILVILSNYFPQTFTVGKRPCD